ncbi:MAG TPA: hypothetical protein VMB04_10980 [Mycobacterium sp.]|nr:hypothetical protein [Mycobacterium sp.]
MRVRCVLSATVAAVAVFAAPGCTRVVTGRPAASALSGAGAQPPVIAAPKRSVCEEVLAPLSPIQSRGPAEPALRIPQPPGWQRATELDSEIVRYAMTNQDLAGNGFMPTAVVTLEYAPGTNQDQQKIFDQERAMLSDRLGVTHMRTTETTRCGQRAEVVSYDAPPLGQIPPRAAMTLIVIGAFSGNEYAATVTVQAANADNPTYVRDAQAILTGFQMLPPAKG